jgi:antitoxin component of MazEF toxin-antitoxin module
MTSLKLHYDGWLKIPAALLRALGAKTGDTVEVESREGGLVLRVGAGKTAASELEPATESAPAQGLPSRPTAKQRRRAATSPASSLALPPSLRGAGRKISTKRDA